MIIVVGSGAGGATVAKELALSGLSVTLIEKGPLIKTKNAFHNYDPTDYGLDLLKTTCGGGSTMVAAGNGVRVLQNELHSMGIDISSQLSDAEQELGVKPLPDSHQGDGTKILMDSARALNLDVIPMPKFIRPGECKPCGKCAFGCPRDAKWTSMDFVKQAQKAGANVIFNTEVNNLIIEEDTIKGVNISSRQDAFADFEKTSTLNSNQVVLAAGAIETARILQKSGIEAGDSFFMDTFVTVGGILEGVGFNEEVTMNALIEGDNFILAPHFSTFISQKLKKKGAHDRDILGLMVKIKDEFSGRITTERVIKYNTLQDVRFLAEGSAVAGSILSAAGVKPDTIVSTHPRGAHPGGTAPIGKTVDENLETKIKGLFVADASVLPLAPGAPPILTIIALAKRLAGYLIENQAQ